MPSQSHSFSDHRRFLKSPAQPPIMPAIVRLIKINPGVQTHQSDQPPGRKKFPCHPSLEMLFAFNH
ncbi:hypothetical protein AM571_PC00777 (plasmid) [Rhizobium etli 8C-3]|uniref:Uncharacterized protein n=1 Tax=Rhizobium etli 8C-3 TaxID=538025 RepID=A0A1L5PEC3_RHIET|nr:hypothetical protein AM571_PC00777 [Rhizobium etli 8C-3]